MNVVIVVVILVLVDYSCVSQKLLSIKQLFLVFVSIKIFLLWLKLGCAKRVFFFTQKMNTDVEVRSPFPYLYHFLFYGALNV